MKVEMEGLFGEKNRVPGANFHVFQPPQSAISIVALLTWFSGYKLEYELLHQYPPATPLVPLYHHPYRTMIGLTR